MAISHSLCGTVDKFDGNQFNHSLYRQATVYTPYIIQYVTIFLPTEPVSVGVLN